MFSNFTNVSTDSLLGPDNPCIRYVGNSFLITWWQYLFEVTRCYRNLSYTPVFSICVRLGGRSAPSADRHYTYHQLGTEWRVLSPFRIAHFLCCTPSVYTLSVRSLMVRDSSVDIATRYRLNGPGIESRLWRDFPYPPLPALRPTQPLIQWLPSLSRQ